MAKEKQLPGPSNRRPFVWVDRDDRKGALKVLDTVRQNASTALDTEFPPTGPRKHEAIIWSLSGAHNQRFVLHGRWLQPDSPFAEWIADPNTRLVYFSFPADADIIQHNTGVDPEESFYADAMTEGWCVDNTKKKYALKLEGRDYLNWYRDDYPHLFSYTRAGQKKKIVIQPDLLWDGPLPEEMLEIADHDWWIELFKHYNADDAEETHALHRKHKVRLKRWRYWNMYQKLDRPYAIAIRRMGKRGIPIDMAALEDLDRRISIKMLRERTVLYAMIGREMSLSPQSKAFRDLIFNEWEWPTYEDLMSEKTQQPQLNKTAWLRYHQEEGFAFAKHMMEYNKLTKRKGTFVDGIRNGVLYGPGADRDLLFSEFNQVGTRTGRKSSRKFKVTIQVERTYKTRPPKMVDKTVDAGMNMLNFPNAFNDEDGVRAVVTPPPPDEEAPEGYGMIVGDFSGFELYTTLFMMAFLFPEIRSHMLKALKEGKDVHSMTAAAVCELDCDWTEVKLKYPGKRNNEGKRCNFNLLYGGGARMLCRIMGWDTRDERNLRKAQRMIDIWQDLWPEMPKYQRKIVDYAYEHGYVITIAGNRLQLRDGLDSDDDGIVHHYENMAKNGGSQGSAAAIVKMAQIAIENDRELMNKYRYRQLFNVYDEIVGYARLKYIEEATARVTWHMQQPFTKERESVGFPIWPVEVKHAPNWRAAK